MRPSDPEIAGLESLQPIGRGGSGRVYAATDLAHGRRVALKVFDAVPDDDGRRRFDRERRAMGSLGSHPGIVTVLQSGFAADGRPYLVMDLIEGGSLEDRLRLGPLPVDEAIDIALQVADALVATHAAGIVHHDVKPANILLESDGRALLTDFGVAAVDLDRTLRLTISATPAFAAPEVLQGRESDARSDVHALAATLFAALEGAPPFGAASETTLGVMHAIMHEPAPDLANPGVNRALQAVIHRGLAKDPDDRWPDMAGFRDALTAARFVAVGDDHADAFRAAATPTAVRPRRRPFVAAGISLVAVLGGTLAVAASRTGRVTIPPVDGVALADAVSTLEAAGFAPTHERACSTAIATGTEPTAGTELDPGSPVQIVHDVCIVPDFVGLRLPVAIDLVLTIDGLSIEWDDHCDDLVLGQDPAAGTSVAYDTTVSIDLRPCPEPQP